jgi:hypothetical protein
MPITINGSGTVTGISAGGLPDDCIVTADIAAGAVNQAKRSEQLTLDTAQTAANGTVMDFTGIPSWVKRVTVIFAGMSISSTTAPLIRLGTSGGIQSTSYSSTSTSAGSGVTTTSSTTGFVIFSSVATDAISGSMVVKRVSGNTWVAEHVVKKSASETAIGAGDVTLSGTLDRIRVTTSNGLGLIDAGTINILYE